jgi:hypothetical protein
MKIGWLIDVNKLQEKKHSLPSESMIGWRIIVCLFGSILEMILFSIL